MQTYTVYFMDYVKGEKTPIGMVVERRRKHRPDNVSGLLKIAREVFGSGPQSAIQIVLDKSVLMGPESGL